MNHFYVRVVLHGANYEDYKTLYRLLRANGIVDVIQSSDGMYYKLPPGEYVLSSNQTASETRRVVKSMANNTGRANSVIVLEWTSASWEGLDVVSHGTTILTGASL